VPACRDVGKEVVETLRKQRGREPSTRGCTPNAIQRVAGQGEGGTRGQGDDAGPKPTPHPLAARKSGDERHRDKGLQSLLEAGRH